jgi:hypothetical protein
VVEGEGEEGEEVLPPPCVDLTNYPLKIGRLGSLEFGNRKQNLKISYQAPFKCAQKPAGHEKFIPLAYSSF